MIMYFTISLSSFSQDITLVPPSDDYPDSDAAIAPYANYAD